MEQYKYGPLTWATIDDDSGNYYYPGTPPIGYDNQGIPIDERGLQCLDILCPVHPDYQMKDAQFCAAIHDYLPTVKEWTEWFEKEFIDISEERCQREIVRWYNKQSSQTKEFQELASNCSSIAELAEKIFGNHTEDVVS